MLKIFSSRMFSLSKFLVNHFGKWTLQQICINLSICQPDSRHFGATKSAQDISAQKKNELTLLYSELIRKNSYAKLIVLRLMVTHYIGNMIAFLRCHNVYLSITIISKLSVLNHKKILYYCNCHATISTSIHTFASFFRKL